MLRSAKKSRRHLVVRSPTAEIEDCTRSDENEGCKSNRDAYNHAHTKPLRGYRI